MGRKSGGNSVRLGQRTRLCAQKLVAAVLSGELPADWEEIKRVAALPEYRILDELELLRAEVENQIGR